MSTEHRFPVFVYPTLHCNFSCSYCFNLSGPSEPGDSFLLNFWDAFLADCVALGVPEIRVSGGEPLLISDIEQRCRAVLDSNMRYTLLSNGSLLEKHLGWLTEYPPATLWLSYHREFFSIAAFERRVKYAADVLPFVGIHVFSNDVESDPEIVERAVCAGAQRIKILSLTAIGRCAETKSGGVLPRDTIARMSARWQALSNRELEIRVEGPAVSDLGISGASSCVLRERPLLSINHDGFVYSCCVTLGTRSCAIGTLQTESLEQIVRRSSSPAAKLPCANLIPSITSNDACCPLRLIPLIPLAKL